MEEELRLPVGEEVYADIIAGGAWEQDATVRAGDASVTLLARFGELPKGTVLTGQFILGETRFYGRFTQAQTPEGKTYPVCMELRQGGPGGRGAPIEANVGPDAVRVWSRVRLVATRGFE
jgi:serine/threonine-protein kinase